MKRSILIAVTCTSVILGAQVSYANTTNKIASGSSATQCIFGNDCPVPGKDGGISYFNIDEAKHGNKFRCTLTSEGGETRAMIYGDTTHFIIPDIPEHIAKPVTMFKFGGYYSIPTVRYRHGQFLVRHSGGTPGFIICTPDP